MDDKSTSCAKLTIPTQILHFIRESTFIFDRCVENVQQETRQVNFIDNVAVVAAAATVAHSFFLLFLLLFLVGDFFSFFPSFLFSLSLSLICFVINCVSWTHKFTGADSVRLCRMTE